MMFIWSEDIATGNRQIDDQHKEIFNKADQVFQLTQASEMTDENKESIQKAFKYLVSYVFEHFHDEEELMKMHDYVGLEEHKELHVAYMKKIGVLHKKIREEGMTEALVEEFKFLIVELLVEHIDDIDKKFVATLKR